MSDRVVLCVDDEALILMALQLALRSDLGSGFRVETCVDPVVALTHLAELSAGGEELAALVSDWRMPRMRGDAFLRKVRSEYSQLPLILLTGYADVDLVRDLETEIGLQGVFQKPCSTKELARVIRDLEPVET